LTFSRWGENVDLRPPANATPLPGPSGGSSTRE
jgi:hypothetical protein